MGGDFTNAVVDEFRVLFTHNIHQKQRKWFDGVLMLHRFNHRLMLYDEFGYLIDEGFIESVDTGYNLSILNKMKTDAVSGSQEILLNSTIVTVEEYVSTITRDLSPLYQTAGVDPRQPSRADVVRARVLEEIPMNSPSATHKEKKPKHGKKPSLGPLRRRFA